MTDSANKSIISQFEEARAILSLIKSKEEFPNLTKDQLMAVAQITSEIESLIKTHRKYLKPFVA